MSYNLIRAEMLLTQVLISVPILNLFWREYAGMSQFDIAISQAAFMVAMLLLDIPFGALADLFSRKWANVVGDAVLSVALIGYAFADSLTWVIIAELGFALGSSISGGADGPLLEQYCDKLGKDYQKENARIMKWVPMAIAAGFGLGGLIGSYNVQLVMLISAIPPIAGAICGIFLHEDRSWLATHAHGNADTLATKVKLFWTGIGGVIKYCMHGHKELAVTIWARAILNESTHGLVWVTTPLMIAAGLPLWLVGLGWAVINISASGGAMLAEKFGTQLSTRQVAAYGLVPYLIGCTLMGWRTNIWTIGLITLMGLMRGWQQSTMGPRIQQLAPRSIKTAVNSVASTLSRLMYIPLVLIIGSSGTTSPSRALLVNSAIFALLGVLLLPMLARHSARSYGSVDTP